MDIQCGGLTFVSDFDSSNIAKVERASITEGNDKGKEEKTLVCNSEFNIWTRPDCAGTEFENVNRSWFYFGVKGGPPSSCVRLNIVNVNRHSKLYSGGMSPVYRVPPCTKWRRVKDIPAPSMMKDDSYVTFGYHPLDNVCSTTYFAFTYPYSVTDLQNTIRLFEYRLRSNTVPEDVPKRNVDDIYYHRECLVESLEGRPVDLITISSHHGITGTREPRLGDLFPDDNTPRPYQFNGKKVIFFSARVHPGETPSSFVMNGVLKLLLNKKDAIAAELRKRFVFKLIPMLNPDGVSKGYSRTDTRGVNLNRYYLNPSRILHPSVFAARAIVLYYHLGGEVEETVPSEGALTAAKHINEPLIADNPAVSNCAKVNITLISEESDTIVTSQNQQMDEPSATINQMQHWLPFHPSDNMGEQFSQNKQYLLEDNIPTYPSDDSGLFLYVDFHAHSSKKGIFMYGNHFESTEDKMECMLLPKLMTVNNQHFHYSSCNFSKHNMYVRDRRDGLSREGCGRVAVYKATGLIKSYTLECNFNTGCCVNMIPPLPMPLNSTKHVVKPLFVPPKYTPKIYEEVGQALCVSILDMIESNPNSRLSCSQYKTLQGVKEALRLEIIDEKKSDTPMKRKRKDVSKRRSKTQKLDVPPGLPMKTTANCDKKCSNSSARSRVRCTALSIVPSTSNLTLLKMRETTKSKKKKKKTKSLSASSEKCCSKIKPRVKKYSRPSVKKIKLSKKLKI